MASDPATAPHRRQHPAAGLVHRRKHYRRDRDWVAALWAFVASFIRTTGAFSGLATIVGTVVGFLAGAFIAVGLFPEAVRNTINALPFAQSAMLMRREFTAETLATLVGDQPEAIAGLSAFYGITLFVGDWEVTVPTVIVVLTACTVVFAALAALRIRARIT